MNDRQSAKQLIRLNTVTDVIYGIIIWRFFYFIPKPVTGSFGFRELGPYLSENYLLLIIALIGILVTAIYWIQNNTLTSLLKGTNNLHSAIRLIQLLFLMTFLYSMKFGIDNGSSSLSRTFESTAAAMMGIMAGLGFLYASGKNRLILEEVSKSETWETSITILAEPLSAIFTLIFINYQWLWEISWLSYPIFKKLLSLLTVKLKYK
jgi:hypothetical protein